LLVEGLGIVVEQVISNNRSANDHKVQPEAEGLPVEAGFPGKPVNAIPTEFCGNHDEDHAVHLQNGATRLRS